MNPLMKDDPASTQRMLASKLARWSSLIDHYAAPAYADAYVLCDASERVIKRIDQPRVQNLPKLRYASPDPVSGNWTVLSAESARAAVLALDAQAPAFAPHRALHVRELAQEQAQAAEHGLDLLLAVEPPLLDDLRLQAPRG